MPKSLILLGFLVFCVFYDLSSFISINVKSGVKKENLTGFESRVYLIRL